MLLLPPGGLCTLTDVVTAGLTPAATTVYCYGTVSSSFFSSSSPVPGTDETTGATG